MSTACRLLSVGAITIGAMIALGFFGSALRADDAAPPKDAAAAQKEASEKEAAEKAAAEKEAAENREAAVRGAEQAEMRAKVRVVIQARIAVGAAAQPAKDVAPPDAEKPATDTSKAEKDKPTADNKTGDKKPADKKPGDDKKSATKPQLTDEAKAAARKQAAEEAAAEALQMQTGDIAIPAIDDSMEAVPEMEADGEIIIEGGAVDVAVPDEAIDAAPAVQVIEQVELDEQAVPQAALVINGGIQVNGGKVDKDAVLKQLTAQLHPVLAAELRFIRQIANPAPEHRAKIKAAGEAGLRQVAEKFVASGKRARHGAMIFAGNQAVAVNAGGNAQTEARDAIHAAVYLALKEAVSAEQLADFDAELAAFKARRQEAALNTFVALLDRSLHLSAEQRGKITENVKSHWKDDWNGWWMLEQYGDQFFPALPDKYVSEALDADQRVLWRNTQKIQLQDDPWNGGFIQVQDEQDGWWEAGSAAQKQAATPAAVTTPATTPANP